MALDLHNHHGFNITRFHSLSISPLTRRMWDKNALHSHLCLDVHIPLLLIERAMICLYSNLSETAYRCFDHRPYKYTG